MGAVLGGVILDKTKKFKMVTFLTYASTMISMAIFAGLLSQSSIPLDFTLIGLLGFFLTGYLPIGFEFAAEITYPVSEGISSCLLSFAIGLCGFLLTSLNQEGDI